MNILNRKLVGGLISAIVVISFSCLASEEDVAYEKALKECMAISEPLSPLLEAVGMDKEEYCSKNANSERQWVLDGSLVVRVTESGCVFEAITSNTAAGCLPDMLSGIKTVRVVAAPLAQTKLVVEVVERLRTLGVEQVLMGATE